MTRPRAATAARALLHAALGATAAVLAALQATSDADVPAHQIPGRTAGVPPPPTTPDVPPRRARARPPPRARGPPPQHPECGADTTPTRSPRPLPSPYPVTAPHRPPATPHPDGLSFPAEVIQQQQPHSSTPRACPASTGTGIRIHPDQLSGITGMHTRGGAIGVRSRKGFAADGPELDVGYTRVRRDEVGWWRRRSGAVARV